MKMTRKKFVEWQKSFGYVRTKSVLDANLVIFNTCCIRENAEEKLFGKLGSLKNIKAKTNAIIAIGGCMMQEEHIVEKINKSYKFVDIIFGTHTLHKFREYLSSNKPLCDIQHIDRRNTRRFTNNKRQ